MFIVHFTFIEADGEVKKVNGKIGESVMQIAHDNDVELEGISIQYNYIYIYKW